MRISAGIPAKAGVLSGGGVVRAFARILRVERCAGTTQGSEGERVAAEFLGRPHLCTLLDQSQSGQTPSNTSTAGPLM